MQRLRILLRVLSVAWSARRVRPGGVAVVLIATLVLTGVAVSQGLSIYRPFRDDSGFVQSAPSGVTISTSNGSIVTVTAPLDESNEFFQSSFGTNGQACVTCHQPAQGFTVHVAVIDQTFATSGLTDPLFRLNDTANDPNGNLSTGNFSLILNRGVARIGKTFAANPNFGIEPQSTSKFGTLPLGPVTNTNDPQHPGQNTLSLFRRPLVNTNVHLDSSVLWDGRSSIGNMRAQVIGAAQTLLLATNPSNDDADQVAAFMLGVYSDQSFDTAAGTDANGNCTFTQPGQLCGAQNTSANGAVAGVNNLLSFGLSDAVPCNTPSTANLLQASCATNVPGYTLFDAWKNLPSNTGINAGRASVARGQEIFNSRNLTIPAGGIAGLSEAPGATIHCTTCHSKSNLGNNTDATLFVRVGTDSLDIINKLITNPGNASPETVADLRVYADSLHVGSLPLYCLRPNSDPTPFSGPGGVACGNDPVNHPGDIRTTDPGHAMVSGAIADVGEFKPPVLRGLAARSPYFHAGMADNIQMLVHFYNARFQIGLTEDEVNDLGAFLEAQ
jgi:cytochrome c peroxidase